MGRFELQVKTIKMYKVTLDYTKVLFENFICLPNEMLCLQ